MHACGMHDPIDKRPLFQLELEFCMEIKHDQCKFL